MIKTLINSDGAVDMLGNRRSEATSPPHSQAGSRCPLAAALCLALTAPYFSTTGVHPLLQGYRAEVWHVHSFYLLPVSSPFITLIVAAIQPAGGGAGGGRGCCSIKLE